MSTRQEQILQFGKFQIDASARSLRREEAIVKLNSRAFDVLLYLAQNPGKVLTREELLKNVWPDAFVDEHSLAQSISVLRRALEEKPGDNSYIVTLPGRGYQFVSEVQVVTPGVGNAPPDVTASGGSNPSGLIFQQHTVETSVITSNQEKEQLSLPALPARPLIRAIAGLLAAVVVIALMVRFRAPRPHPSHELVQRQLTADPPGSNISSQAISRDGKFLAYGDFISKNHLHLLAIDSGEVRDIPSLTGYEVDDWLPDGNHLLLESDLNGGGLWTLSTWDLSLRKLWSGPASLARVSPDGSYVAFVNDDREIWLMGAGGEEPHRIFAIDAQERASGLAWSPTGQRLAYIRLGSLARPEGLLETSDLVGGTRTLVLSDPHLSDFGFELEGIAWLPDERIFYRTNSGDNESSLWAIKTDSNSGKTSGGPNRVAGWKDLQADGPKASGDGKRLIVGRRRTGDTIYVGDLASGNKGYTPRRVLLDDWSSAVTSWAQDSKAILFYSQRNGKWAVFRQDMDGNTPETLISGPESYFRPRVSPGGTLLYTATASTRLWEPGDPTIRLMSTPLQGGTRSPLMIGRHEYRCGVSPSSSCVVSELKDSQLTFFYLDPLKGGGEKIASLTYKAGQERWDLSPDGSMIAIVDEGTKNGEIRILNLADRKISLLRVRNHQQLQHVSWAADGKSLFAVAFDTSVCLLSVDANGLARLLYEIPENAGWISSITPSPDGKHLAFSKRVTASDVMLLENF
jgi:DNA-binding winged helix-turn-helix (wHTH) protein/Tol biopolymer transport system component